MHRDEEFATPAWLTASSGFLEHLDQEDRERLTRLAVTTRFAKGDVIFNAGVPGDKVYFVEAGRVKIAQLSKVGREMILWFCLPGDVFGLAAMPGLGPRLVYAQACAETSVRYLTGEAFHSFLLGNPRVSIELVNLLLGRLYSVCDGLLNVAEDSAESRLRRLLSRLGHRYGRQIGDELSLELPLTQQEIADMIGASRQTTSSLLNQLKQSGEIRVESRKIFLSRNVHAAE